MVHMEQKVKRNDVELEEEEFWEKELIQIEQENTKQLKDQLQERQKRIDFARVKRAVCLRPRQWNAVSKQKIATELWGHNSQGFKGRSGRSQGKLTGPRVGGRMVMQKLWEGH